MLKQLSKSIYLLVFTLVIICVLYPLIMWAIGQSIFPFKANGSIINGPDGKPVGSELIAQQFTKDEYFQPRPSAASYNGSASSSSALSVSNYALRNRVATMIGPIVKYKGGSKDGQLVGPDVELWFQKDIYQGNPHIVAQWADIHNSLAQTWVSTDSIHSQFVADWSKTHHRLVDSFIKNNPQTPQPQPADLAVVFFENFSKENPGKFLSAVTDSISNGNTVTLIKSVKTGMDIQSVFFDMWRQDNPDVNLQDVPGDMVTTSASGLDPHISLQNAEFQLERVASKWASDLNRNPNQIRQEIKQILDKNASAPLGGIWGEKFINVLQVNLELNRRYGNPK
jgi:potassium-transporting ATPase KdpC subunit